MLFGDHAFLEGATTGGHQEWHQRSIGSVTGSLVHGNEVSEPSSSDARSEDPRRHLKDASVSSSSLNEWMDTTEKEPSGISLIRPETDPRDTTSNISSGDNSRR